MDSEEYIEQQDDLLPDPIECKTCGDKVDNSGLVRLDENRNPLCKSHKDSASEVVKVSHHIGHVNNGMHPETGETSHFDSNSWYKIVDEEKIS